MRTCLNGGGGDGSPFLLIFNFYPNSVALSVLCGLHIAECNEQFLGERTWHFGFYHQFCAGSKQAQVHLAGDWKASSIHLVFLKTYKMGHHATYADDGRINDSRIFAGGALTKIRRKGLADASGLQKALRYSFFSPVARRGTELLWGARLCHE